LYASARGYWSFTLVCAKPGAQWQGNVDLCRNGNKIITHKIFGARYYTTASIPHPSLQCNSCSVVLNLDGKKITYCADRLDYLFSSYRFGRDNQSVADLLSAKWTVYVIITMVFQNIYRFRKILFNVRKYFTHSPYIICKYRSRPNSLTIFNRRVRRRVCSIIKYC